MSFTTATSSSSSLRLDPSRWTVHGYAIVSEDDRYADAAGRMPEALRNEADWRMFQAGLDRMDAIALGRLSHAATPNPKGRLRIIVSSTAASLEHRDDGWWWNPAAARVDEMLKAVLPEGGAVGVPGGQGVFDLFLRHGYSSFHLSRAGGVHLRGGIALFSACEDGTAAEDVLKGRGLTAGPTELLDADNAVTLTVWGHGGLIQLDSLAGNDM